VLNQPSFYLNSFIAQARDFSAWRLNEILKLVYNLDYESKTGGEDSARLMLQTFIFQVKQLKASDRTVARGVRRPA
jgi:DNA polymerase III delta subunit